MEAGIAAVFSAENAGSSVFACPAKALESLKAFKASETAASSSSSSSETASETAEAGLSGLFHALCVFFGVHTALKSGIAVLVIDFSLLLISEDRICFRNILEFLLSFRIPRVGIRMIFLRQLSVSFFDL